MEALLFYNSCHITPIQNVLKSKKNEVGSGRIHYV